MMTDDQTPELLPWTTPTLDLLGTMDDVHAGGGQADIDGSFEPGIAAS